MAAHLLFVKLALTARSVLNTRGHSRSPPCRPHFHPCHTGTLAFRSAVFTSIQPFCATKGHASMNGPRLVVLLQLAKLVSNDQPRRLGTRVESGLQVTFDYCKPLDDLRVRGDAPVLAVVATRRHCILVGNFRAG